MAANERMALVVDDDGMWREVVAAVLEAEGFDVVTAANGLEALWRLRRGGLRPDLVVLDLSMPVLSGWQFRAEQLRDPRLRDIPVVVVSGDDLGRTRADAYLAKPCAPDDLLEAVRGLVEVRAAA
jgi:CheY-like chemotaxis protein